jgi:hypothetical protein
MSTCYTKLATLPMGQIVEVSCGESGVLEGWAFNASGGRTFAQRPTLVRHGPERPEHVYLLAHEDLQQAAAFLAGERLAACRLRLHTWVDGHRERGWDAHPRLPAARLLPQSARGRRHPQNA